MLVTLRNQRVNSFDNFQVNVGSNLGLDQFFFSSLNFFFALISRCYYSALVFMNLSNKDSAK